MDEGVLRLVILAKLGKMSGRRTLGGNKENNKADFSVLCPFRNGAFDCAGITASNLRVSEIPHQGTK